MKKTINVGVVGVGRRGNMLLRDILLPMDDVNILGVCDLYQHRAERGRDMIEKAKGNTPLCTLDYHDILEIKDLDALFILSSWESHTEIAIEAMNRGLYVGTEVGGAYSVEDCWELIYTYRKTGFPCMMLENCCYGKDEMMALNMTQLGLFGDIVHCTGGYCHDLRDQVATGKEDRRYRLRNYLFRNADNYPTHALGPISRVLNINQGNRMLSLTSTGSASMGINEYIKAVYPEKQTRNFAQSDVVTTVIKCSGGQTIRLSLDTCLPRPYSREFSVRGTKGAFFNDTNCVFLDNVHNDYEDDWSSQWGNAKDYYEKYKHPVWDQYEKEGIKQGHGGMDWLVFRDFINAVKNGVDTPIDTYDSVLWMSISALTEKSITLGSAPVEIPDFKNGKWMLGYE